MRGGLLSGRSNIGLLLRRLLLFSVNSIRTCSAATLDLSALWISFFVSSSTSLPSGAFVTKSISVTVKSSRRIRSPPLSPSTKAVTVFLVQSSLTVSGTLVPLSAMAFLNPFFRSVSTSALPSTIMISSDSSISGPAGRWSLPYSVISWMRTETPTSSASSWLSGIVISTICRRSSFARSITCVRFEMRTSSIFWTLSLALHGPMRWMISRLAAMMHVSALSSDDGMMIVP